MKVLHWPFLVLRKGFLSLRAQQSNPRKLVDCFVVLFGLLAMTVPLPILASEPVDLGEVVVESAAEKAKTPSLDRSAAATVLIPEESKQEALTLSELLEESAGVHVKRYGGLDDFSVLSLRGSTAGQVEIYLDDIPLTAAQGAITDLGIVPLAAIGRAEVYRGGSPGMLPESTIGGVVVLKSKMKPEKRDASIYGLAGSFETIKGRASYSESLPKVSPVIAYEYARSLGDFLYKDDNGTRFNTSDDQLVHRQNNDFTSNSLFTKFIFDMPGKTSLSFTNIFFQKEQGVPGIASRQSLIARLGTWREIASAVLENGDLFSKNVMGHADIFFDYLNSQFFDPNAQISITPQDTDDKTFRFGENLRGGVDLGSHQRLKAFVAHRAEFYLPYNRLAVPAHGPQDHRNSINAGLEDEIMLFRDRLNIVPSVRVENLYNGGAFSDRSDHQFSAKLGVSVRVVDDLYWKSNIYRGFRNPTFSELFGDTGMLQGNPDLKPEKAINFDTGLSYDFPGASWFEGGHIEATYYRTSVDNLIQFVQTSNFTAKAFNMNQALLQGLEAMVDAKFLKRFKISASYTLQYAKDDSDNPDTRGKYLPGRPKHELYAMAGWHESWLPWFATNVFCDLNYMSGNYLDTQNLLKVTNRSLLGSGVSVTFADRFITSFSVQNILNERISDILGYPLPGRSYWGTLEIKI